MMGVKNMETGMKMTFAAQTLSDIRSLAELHGALVSLEIDPREDNTWLPNNFELFEEKNFGGERPNTLNRVFGYDPTFYLIYNNGWEIVAR